MTDGSEQVDLQPNPLRVWLAVSLATLVQTISYGAIVVGVVSAVNGSEVSPLPAFAVGILTVPLVGLIAALVSKRESPLTSVLKGTGVWLVIAVLGLSNPIVWPSVGFAANGVLTLRSPTDRSTRARWVFVLVMALLLLLLVLASVELAILLGALAPLLVVRAADLYTERRARSGRDALGEEQPAD